MRSIIDADGVPWTADEDEVLGGRPTYQIAVVFTAPDGRRRWAPVERGKLAKLTDKELLALLLTAGGAQATRG